LYLTWGPRSAQAKERKHSQNDNNQSDDIDNSMHGRLQRRAEGPAQDKPALLKKVP